MTALEYIRPTKIRDILPLFEKFGMAGLIDSVSLLAIEPTMMQE
jgi:hypothetical protein